MEEETSNTEESFETGITDDTQKKKIILAVGVFVLILVVATFFITQNQKQPLKQVVVDNRNIPEPSEPSESLESKDSKYGGPFYRKEDKVFANDPKNVSINHIELPNADPDTFSFLQGLAGYDKDSFHYLDFDYEVGEYLPASIPIDSGLKRLFDSVEDPIRDVKMSWNSNTDVVFENVTYRKLSHYSDSNALRSEIYELLNNGNPIGYIWAIGVNKVNVSNNKLYLYTHVVHEVESGNQPKMILDVVPSKTTIKPGGSKIYYTESYNSLDFYEYDTVTKTERKIPIQYRGTTTYSSRITISPDEKHLLVQSRGEDAKTNTLLVKVSTGEVEVARSRVAPNRSGVFPFAVSPQNDKVFFLRVPYEGYLFSNPFYVQKDTRTGVWSDDINISSINMEVGGGWNIDTGQWSISPSGKYLAVADATENSIYICGGGLLGETPRAHNVIKILDLESLKIQTLIVKNPYQDFTLNSWMSDESGIFATKQELEVDPTQNCGDFSGESSQEFYPLL